MPSVGAITVLRPALAPRLLLLLLRRRSLLLLLYGCRVSRRPSVCPACWRGFGHKSTVESSALRPVQSDDDKLRHGVSFP